MASQTRTQTQNATPNWAVGALGEDNIHFAQAWYNFFALLTAQPGPIVSVSATASPFVYTASSNGVLAISGGTVSSISFARARVSGVDVGFTSGLVPMAQGDSVTITYSAAPALSFVPS